MSSVPWRASPSTLTGARFGLVTLLALVVLLVLGLATTVVLIGIPLLLAFGLSGLPVAAVERRRLRIVDDEPARTPHLTPDGPGLAAWVRTRLQEKATWREFAYGILLALILWPLDAIAATVLLAVPVSLIAAPVTLAAAEDGEVKFVKAVVITTAWPAALAAVIGVVTLIVGVYLLTV